MQEVKIFCKKNKLLCVTLLLIAVAVGMLGIMGQEAYSRSTLSIYSTGEKNEMSFGTDIRIASIQLNGKKLAMNDVKVRGDWTEENGYFQLIQAEKTNGIEIPFHSEDELKVTFLMQEGSGYVTISRDNALIEERNLYSPIVDHSEYEIHGTVKTSMIQQILPFFILLLSLVVVYLLAVKLLAAICGRKKIPSNWIHLLLILCGAAALMLAVETISGNLENIGIVAAIENIVLYYTMMLAVYVLTVRVSWSVAIVSAFWMVFAILNYYVVMFRRSPITPGDFFTIQTAGNVAGQYQYRLTASICYASVAFICCFAVLCWFGKNSDRSKRKIRILVCVLESALLCFILLSGTYHKTMDFWNLHNNIKKYGIGVNLISGIYSMQVDTPDDYSKEKIEQFLEGYAETDNGFRPNVIVVMNEAFSDLSIFVDGLDSNTFMPYYNSIAEDAVKGVVFSSVYGGATANAEYEMLTGNSLYFMQGHVPYQQNIYRDTYSVAGVLKQRGYSATAVHPYYASGYNRPNVYKFFGFDDFIDIESFDDSELVRKRYISDKDAYRKIIDVFEDIQQTEEPAFIFTITMQNHSAYDTGYYGENVIQVPGLEGQYPDVEEYLTLIKEADNALPILFDYFSNVDEETVILLFGDHQPYVSTSFYEETLNKTTNEFTYADWQKRYEVPFVIWANYDIEEEAGICTSMNYLSAMLFDRAGMYCTPYQNYLLELQQVVPVITRTGFTDVNGNWYAQHEETDVAKKLDEYWNLEYYHIFKEEVLP